MPLADLQRLNVAKIVLHALRQGYNAPLLAACNVEMAALAQRMMRRFYAKEHPGFARLIQQIHHGHIHRRGGTTRHALMKRDTLDLRSPLRCSDGDVIFGQQHRAVAETLCRLRHKRIRRRVENQNMIAWRDLYRIAQQVRWQFHSSLSSHQKEYRTDMLDDSTTALAPAALAQTIVWCGSGALRLSHTIQWFLNATPAH